MGRLLGDVRPLLMVTDPPYGVEYDPSWRNQAGAAKTKRTGKVLNDDRADWREAWALVPRRCGLYGTAHLHAGTAADSLTAVGFAIRSQIIWAKDRLVLSRGDYHWQHEPCWYAVRAKGKGHWAGTASRRRQADRQPGPGRRHRARHAETGGMHAAADPEQLEPGTGNLRAVHGIWHHADRGRDHRPGLLRSSS